MKVSELIELLEEQDPNAEVLVMSQPNWPLEPRLERGIAKNDVFLVEGEQLRYGSKTAWSVATR